MTGSPLWMNVAVDLYEKGIAKPVLWLGDDRHYENAKAVFGDDVVRMLHFVHRPYQLQGIEYCGENSEFFYSENYLRAKDICIKMMDRLDLYGTFGRLDREVYFHNLCIWALAKLEKERPDALLMVERPHSHAQYLIYEICLFLGVHIAHFIAWAILPLNFLYDKTNGHNVRKSFATDRGAIDIFDQELDKYVSKLSGLSDKEGKHEPSYMKHQRLRSRWLVKKKDAVTRGSVLLYREIRHHLGNKLRRQYNPINPYDMGVWGWSKIRSKRQAKLLGSCRKAGVNVEFSNQYVYFPLHFEPERTTNPDGGRFHDHFVVLVALRSILPTNVDILVKEHPSQFFYANKGSRGRSPLFYDLVKNIKGVRFVGTEGDSIDFIRKSVFVATITGSVGLEAALMGKKCLTFGQTWYEGCPNTINWKDGITYEDIVSGYIQKPDNILEYLRNVMNQYSVPLLHNPSADIVHKEYVSDEFHRIQRDEVSRLISDFFEAV